MSELDSGERKPKPRKLRPAVIKFACSLIHEARDISGLSLAKLDEPLGLEPGEAQRYNRQVHERGPQNGGIQQLENRVAKFLKRPAHRLLVSNQYLLADEAVDLGMDEIIIAGEGLSIGSPEPGMKLRGIEGSNLSLSYEYNWPTYEQLKNCPFLMAEYRWQWGILWDRDALGVPYTREAQGIPATTPIEEYLSKRAEKRNKHFMIEQVLSMTYRLNGLGLEDVAKDLLSFMASATPTAGKLPEYSC